MAGAVVVPVPVVGAGNGDVLPATLAGGGDILLLNKLHKAISHTSYIYKNDKSSLVQLVLIIIIKR